MPVSNFSRKIAIPMAWLALLASSALAQDAVSLGQPVPAPGPPRGADASNRYLVTFAPGTSPATRAAAAQQAGVTVRFNYAAVDAMAITAPNENAVNALRGHRSVVGIVPDRRLFAMQKGRGNGNG